jgi:O-antigen ligase
VIRGTKSLANVVRNARSFLKLASDRPERILSFFESGPRHSANESLIPGLPIRIYLLIGLVSILGGIAIALYPALVFLLAGFVAVVVIAHLYTFVLSATLFSGIALVVSNPGVAAISHMGMLTIYVAAGSWLLWLNRGAWSRWILLVLSPWIALLIIATISLSWSPARADGIQNILVLAVFVGVMLLSAEQVRESSKLQFSIQNVIIVTTSLAACVFMVAYLFPEVRNYSIGTSARSFSLLALVGVSCLLAKWRNGSKLSLLLAAAIMAVVILSLSRTAFVVSLILVPLARINLRSALGWISFVAWLISTIVIIQILVTRVESIRSRFFEGDLSIEIAGIPINAMGRMEFWTVTIESFRESPWFGAGAGSAQLLMERVFGAGMGVDHPHNEYLRYLHDYGLLGLSVLVVSLVTLLLITFRSWMRADSCKSSAATTHLAAFLATIAIMLAMATDNVLVYLWVMAPFGALVGASIGSASLMSDRLPDPHGTAAIDSHNALYGDQNEAQLARKPHRESANVRDTEDPSQS